MVFYIMRAPLNGVLYNGRLHVQVAPLHELLDFVGASGRRQVDEQNPFSRAVEPPEVRQWSTLSVAQCEAQYLLRSRRTRPPNKSARE